MIKRKTFFFHFGITFNTPLLQKKKFNFYWTTTLNTLQLWKNCSFLFHWDVHYGNIFLHDLSSLTTSLTCWKNSQNSGISVESYMIYFPTFQLECLMLFSHLLYFPYTWLYFVIYKIYNQNSYFPELWSLHDTSLVIQCINLIIYLWYSTDVEQFGYQQRLLCDLSMLLYFT